jgi:glycosyltransferase involved in cell wall biosynthesis
LQYLIETDPVMQDKIILLDGIDDIALDWLYKNCRYTVYPTMYEGWGLPVAESLVYGKLCIASESSSVPEIAGDLISYASPYDTAAWLELMTKFTIEENTLIKMEEDIKRHYKPTPWSYTYKQVAKAVHEVVVDTEL